MNSTVILHSPISDQKWWLDCVNATKPKNPVVEKQSASTASRGRGGAVRGAARGGPTTRGRGTPPARGGVTARGRGGVGPSRGGGAVARGRGSPAKPTAASSNTKCEKTEVSKPVEVRA